MGSIIGFLKKNNRKAASKKEQDRLFMPLMMEEMTQCGVIKYQCNLYRRGLSKCD